jgi:hypothetical protein
MALAPVLLISLLLHAVIGWRIAPDLASVDAALGVALWAALTVSALLMPMGFLARRIAKPPFAHVLTWMGGALGYVAAFALTLHLWRTHRHRELYCLALALRWASLIVIFRRRALMSRGNRRMGAFLASH